MKLVFAILVLVSLIAIALAYPTADELNSVNYTFEQYAAEFGKDYLLSNNLNELSHRKAVFEANLKEIIDFNQQNHSWKMGINQFTDLTMDEFLQLHTGFISSPDQLGIVDDGLLNDTDPLIAVNGFPESVDWSARNMMAKEIRSQGACGSCYSFSAIATLEMYLKAATGKETRLSTQQAVDCLENPRECGGTGGCKGFTATAVLDYAATTGLMSEAEYPYFSGETREPGECKFHPQKVVARAKGTRRIRMNDVNDMMEAIAYYGAVAVSVDATKMKAYESGVMTECHRDWVEEHKMYEVTTNHAVVLVGYGVDENGVGYWKYRNSWGTKWGMNGHGLIYRATNGEREKEFINMNPHAGIACKDEPDTPFVVAGSCGILWNGWVPLGVHGAKP